MEEIRAHKKGLTVLEVASHDGDRIVLSGSKDKTVKSWDMNVRSL